jgi:mRNA degradation ribonuclease J1/J2
MQLRCALGCLALRKSILVASLYDMNCLPIIEPITGSRYVYCQSEPFNEDMEANFDRLNAWLQAFSIPLDKVHASGHANEVNLLRAVDIVNPSQTVYIVHTENPAQYANLLSRTMKNRNVKVVQPQVGMLYEL